MSAWTKPLTLIDQEGKEYHVDMHCHHCEAREDVSENYGKLEEPFRRLGAIRYGKFGNALCILGNAQKMNEIASKLLKREPNLFLNKEAIPGDWY